MKKTAGLSTQSVHAASPAVGVSSSVVAPLVLNAAYAYEDLTSWRAVAVGQAPGDIYSRNTNPTVRAFEEKMAALEGAERAASFATGMAAISNTLFALLSPGQRAISVRDAYGASYLHFTTILPRFNVECAVCDTEDHDGLVASIREGCDLLYLESPTNPMLKVLDLEALATAAHEVGAVVVVDSTFATPINQNPLALGADLVIHSATKFLGGHGDVLGGVACGSAELVDKVFRFRELTGASLDAHSAHLFLRSLKTLALRIERQNANAMAIATYLESHPKVERVFYPGLPNHPGHEVARKQMRGFGGVLSFAIPGGLDAVGRVLERLQYAYMAANLGQVETVVGPPAVTSHVECTEEERAEAGIPEGLIRYAVGIEDLADLEADLENALGAI